MSKQILLGDIMPPKTLCGRQGILGKRYLSPLDSDRSTDLLKQTIFRFNNSKFPIRLVRIKAGI